MTAAIHPATHFIAPDADGDLTLWHGTREDPAPVAVLRECDTDPAVWAVVVAAVSAADRLTDEEREALANAADERGWAMQSNQVSDEVLAHADATFWAAVERILAARGVRAPGDTTADRDALAPLDALLHDWGGREVTDVEHAMIREAADALAQAHHRLTAQPPLMSEAPDRGALEHFATEVCDRNARRGLTEEARHFGRTYARLAREHAAALAARPAPDTLADRVQALDDPAARHYAAFVGAEAERVRLAHAIEALADEWDERPDWRFFRRDAAESLRALLAGRSDASPEGGA